MTVSNVVVFAEFAASAAAETIPPTSTTTKFTSDVKAGL